MRHFWDAAAALDPMAVELDEALFPLQPMLLVSFSNDRAP